MASTLGELILDEIDRVPRFCQFLGDRSSQRIEESCSVLMEPKASNQTQSQQPQKTDGGSKEPPSALEIRFTTAINIAGSGPK